MTGDQARRLKPGDYVCWNGLVEAQLGVITQVCRFGVAIRWTDGRETAPLFNDMKHIVQTDSDGKIIEP